MQKVLYSILLCVILFSCKSKSAEDMPAFSIRELDQSAYTGVNLEDTVTTDLFFSYAIDGYNDTLTFHKQLLNTIAMGIIENYKHFIQYPGITVVFYKESELLKDSELNTRASSNELRIIEAYFYVHGNKEVWRLNNSDLVLKETDLLQPYSTSMPEERKVQKKKWDWIQGK